MKQYIDKDALIAKINHHLQFIPEHTNAFIEGEEHAYRTILSFLDDLEVKEVDLEKEIELVKGDYEQVDVAWNNDFDFIAKHFFELGLRA